MLSDSEIYRQTRKSLAHLDDIIYLDGLALAAQIEPVFGMTDQTRGQTLRRVVRLTIDSLKPAVHNGDAPIDATSYHTLYQYAIARQSMVAIAMDLGISERKAYYALQQGCAAVSRVLQDLIASQHPDRLSPGGLMPGAARVREELERLTTIEKQDVDLRLTLEGAISSTSRLAEQTGAKVRLLAGSADYRVATNRVMIRQAVLNLLSAMCDSKSTVSVTLHQEDNPPEVAITFLRQPAYERSAEASTDPLSVAAQIVDTLGLGWQRTDDSRASTTIVVRLAASQRRTVLVVDDNEGVIALFRRYLAHQPYIVRGARDYDEALAALRQTLPDLVIMDVMLPQRDGWELLQEMRRFAPKNLPVIICSIINDPRLAASLGAAAFLHKPVSRAALLAALNQADQVAE